MNTEWLLISICPPSEPIQPAGVLLLDRRSNVLLFRLKDLLTGNEDVDLLWPHFAEELDLRASEQGAEAVVAWLETTFSNVIRVSEPRHLEAEDALEALNALYDDYVEKRSTAGPCRVGQPR